MLPDVRKVVINAMTPSFASSPASSPAFDSSVAAIHQVELSSICNLRCPYCVSPNLTRPKVHMSREHLARALDWIRFYIERDGYTAPRGYPEVNLAGIGESTIHPEFADFVRQIREAVGPEVRLICATNGIAVTPELVTAVQPYNVRFWLSLHQPARVVEAARLLRDAGLLEHASADFVVAPNDWAGQLSATRTPAAGFQLPCPWIKYGWCMVMADGRVTTCCLDASGAGVIGHVNDPIGAPWRTQPYMLCRTCYQDLGILGYDQRAGVPRLSGNERVH